MFINILSRKGIKGINLLIIPLSLPLPPTLTILYLLYLYILYI